eukprot:1087698-Amphidinium_carterae.1
MRPRVGLRAGTGRLHGDADRPFADSGLSEEGDLHVLRNAHELAIWTARHLEQQDFHAQLDAFDRLQEATTQPICGADDLRPLMNILLGRVRKALMEAAYVRYTRRGAASLESVQDGSWCSSTPNSEGHHSFGTSQEALTAHSAPSTPGSLYLSTPPSANTSLIVEGGLSSRDT